MRIIFLRLWALSLISPLVFAITPPALAGVFADDLSKCLVNSADDNDRSVMVQMLFAATMLNPAVRSMTTITDQQRDAMAQKSKALLTRLLTENCRKEAIAALKNEGPITLRVGVQALGVAASRELMSNPQVARGMSGAALNFNDDGLLKALFKDAGIPEMPK